MSTEPTSFTPSPSISSSDCSNVPFEVNVATATAFLNDAQRAFSAEDPADPNKYPQLLTYLQEYRNKLIDIDDLIAKCSILLRPHTHLIPAFNLFLPQGWSIISPSPTESNLYCKRAKERYEMIGQENSLKFIREALLANGLDGDNYNHLIELLIQPSSTAEDIEAMHNKIVQLLKDDPPLLKSFDTFFPTYLPITQRPSSPSSYSQVESDASSVPSEDSDVEMIDNTLTPSPSSTLYNTTPPRFSMQELASRRGQFGSVGPIRTTNIPTAPPRVRRSYRTRPYRTPSPKLDTRSVSSASPSTTVSGGSDTSEATTVGAPSPAPLTKKKKGRFAFLDEDNDFPLDLLSSNRPICAPALPVVLSPLALPFYPTLCDHDGPTSILEFMEGDATSEAHESQGGRASPRSTTYLMDRLLHRQDIVRQTHNYTDGETSPSLKQQFCSAPNVVGPFKAGSPLAQLGPSPVRPTTPSTSTSSIDVPLKNYRYSPIIYPFDVVSGRKTYLDAVKSCENNGSVGKVASGDAPSFATTPRSLMYLSALRTAGGTSQSPYVAVRGRTTLQQV